MHTHGCVSLKLHEIGATMRTVLKRKIPFRNFNCKIEKNTRETKKKKRKQSVERMAERERSQSIVNERVENELCECAGAHCRRARPYPLYKLQGREFIADFVLLLFEDSLLWLLLLLLKIFFFVVVAASTCVICYCWCRLGLLELRLNLFTFRTPIDW